MISVWKPSQERPIYVLHAHDGEVSTLLWNENERVMITGGTDKTFKLWRFPIVWTGEIEDN